VAGKNKQLQTELGKRYAGKDNVKIFGYVDFMPELYSLADVVVTKPGGLTVSECLMYGLPIIIHTWLPGQEEINYKYLLENKLILPVPANPRAALEHELKTADFAASLKINPKVAEIVQHGEKIKKLLTEML